MRKNHIAILTSALLLFTSSAFASVTTHSFNAYQALLATHVKESTKQGIRAMLVDYNSWSKDARHKEAMSSLLATNPQPLKGKHKMAFWINAYNLLTVDLIIKTGETESIRNQGSLFKNVWKSHSWTIDSKQYTLHQIEHDILRPMGDPRIHMAINCASLSCPDLRLEPYDADTLEQQLNQQSVRFVTNPTKGTVIANQRLTISKIFDWFGSDFGGVDGVAAFIATHANQPKNTSVGDYMDYNWLLNSQ